MSSSLREEALDGWQRLRNGDFEESNLSIHTIPSQVEYLFSQVRYSLGESGEARILIPIQMHEKVLRKDEQRILLIAEATFIDKGKPTRFLSVSCLNQTLESVFADFVEEVLERILTGHRAGEALLSSLQDFKSLLASDSKEIIDDKKIVGLAGELVVLSKILTISSEATQTWRGPLQGLGERHDFRRDSCALEVKTSGRKFNQIVRISSIDQLEAPSSGSLYLVHVTLEKTAHGDISISSLMKNCCKLSADPDLLQSIANAAGCNEPSDEAWNRLTFNLENIAIYMVDNKFPRIVSESFEGCSVPAGVQKVEYEIDLGGAIECKLEDSAHSSIYEKIAV